ncbi:penicillin-binding transpeptidase domain-containing protein [Kitasatospora kazusensis]|uniref:Penicillin-binding transpeptidase domain-containing protein n=1 Tax=Kitasatospora kazusensis TaxID=407974 RepID=A0ABN2ZSR4_9ACTN
MNKGTKIAIGTVCAVLLGAGGYGAYDLTGLAGSSSASSTPTPVTVSSEPPTADQAAAGAKAFLDAWSGGDLAAASALTDQPGQALTALTAFKTKLNPSAITLVPGGSATPASSAAPSASASASASASSGATADPGAPASQVKVGFSAKVEFATTGNAWNYAGALGVVKMSNGKTLVHWAPTVIHPHLGTGESIGVAPIYAPPSSVVDRNGKSLKGFASLDQLLGSFNSQAAGNPGDAGQGVVITDDSGQKPAEKLFTVTDPKPGKPLSLTLDAKVQAAAESALKAHASGLQGSVVAIEPSTGNILAIANTPASYNRAFLGGLAPGSTMKIIDAAALLEAGISPSATMPCPETITVNGNTIANDEKGAFPNNTFTQDFAASCNTAFIQQGMKTLTGSQQADTAKEVFGLGPVWALGLKINPAKIPAPATPNQRAADLIGQGTITMNSLAMASVSATVQNGTFHQPILVPGSKQLPADRTLSGSTLDALRSMMRQVVTSGTAAGVSGLPSGTGAKTGTAEVGNQAKSNSWFTAFSGNLAVAVEIEGGGHGADAAAPAAAVVLQVGNKG